MTEATLPTAFPTRQAAAIEGRSAVSSSNLEASQ
jgi:hypothetical protein